MVSVTSTSQLHLLEFTDRRSLPKELERLNTFAKGRLGIGRTEPAQQVKEELSAFFKGSSSGFQTPLAYHGSEFSGAVWDALRQIPAGATCSYSDVAVRIGRPSAVRAVARANGANQIALVIPCHRVIGTGGSLIGYGGGLWRKQQLLEIERQYLPEKARGTHHVTG